ncbi:MAG: hypothetical protein R2856_14720 [Caldilineaceae bacterium]
MKNEASTVPLPAATSAAGALDCAGSVDVSSMNHQADLRPREWAVTTRLMLAS